MLRKKWNIPAYEHRYRRIVEDAKRRGFTDEELESPYLDKLSYQTKSRRIYRMIELAYYLGKLKGVAECDEGHTRVVLS